MRLTSSPGVPDNKPMEQRQQRQHHRGTGFIPDFLTEAPRVGLLQDAFFLRFPPESSVSSCRRRAAGQGKTLPLKHSNLEEKKKKRKKW